MRGELWPQPKNGAHSRAMVLQAARRGGMGCGEGGGGGECSWGCMGTGRRSG